MKTMQKLLSTTALSVVALMASAAQAAVISYTDLTAGTHSANIGGTSVTAWGDTAQTQAALFGYRSQAGVAGMGIQGHGNNELDFYYNQDGSGDSETMAFDFNSGVSIDEIELSLLFNGPEYSNEHEIAEILIDGHVGRLELLPSLEDTANWFVDGIFITQVSACSSGATLNGGSGCFRISDPFAGMTTMNLDLTAAMIPNVDESDYLFRSVTFSSVPEPGTLALLALGLAGLGLSRRRSA